MENQADPITYLIYLHAALGGIALLAGGLAMIFKKGSPRHKGSGKLFFFCMLGSALIALVVALIPTHSSPFLLAIGVFSLYLLLSGYRALRFKQTPTDLTIDKLISMSMILVGISMILVPIIVSSKLNIVLSVFGAIGIFSGIRDLRLYRKPEQLKKSWLSLHLGNMMGAYIASFTAFLVVNQFFPPLVGWLGPTVVGVIYIVWWNRKLQKPKGKLKA